VCRSSSLERRKEIGAWARDGGGICWWVDIFSTFALVLFPLPLRFFSNYGTWPTHVTVSSMYVAGEARLQRMGDPVDIVELPEGGRGRAVLDSAAGSGAGAATVIVVAMER